MADKLDIRMRGDVLESVATALQPLTPDGRRRVLVACLILLGEDVPWEFVKDDAAPASDGGGR